MIESDFEKSYELYSREIFNFLIEDYGFKFEKTEEIGFGIFSRFSSPDVIIEIGLDLRDRNVGICFFSAKTARSKFQHVVCLSQFLESDKYIDTLRFKVQNGADLQLIFKKYAEILKKYGKAVIRGDLSAFPSRQENYEKLWGR